jgi:hypothetical protein
VLKKKIWANFQRIIDFLPKKMSISTQKYGFGIRDPRSGIRKNLFRIPDPEAKKAPDPGSGSATLLASRLGRHQRWGGGRVREGEAGM